MMTEGKVSASERRAVFVGANAYEAAGGSIARDLFQQDHGGWFEDAALLDRLVDEKLQAEAGAVVAEGWRWVEVARDFPYGHNQGLRRVFPTVVPLTDAEQAQLDALREEMGRIEAEHAETGEDLPEEVDRRLAKLEAEIAVLDERPGHFEADAIACCGAYVSLGHEGRVRIDRGYMRQEDELSAEPGTDDVSAADTRQHDNWARQLPTKPAELWDWLLDLDTDSRAALFAYCAARTLNATHQPYDRRPAAIAHASRLAEALALDMSGQWSATKDGYLGRVTKAQILAAVREAKGEAAAQLIDHLKKGDMAEAAERSLAGTGWLPALLRTPGLQTFAAAADADPTSADEPAAELPAFLTDEREAGEVDDMERVYAVAAE